MPSSDVLARFSDLRESFDGTATRDQCEAFVDHVIARFDALVAELPPNPQRDTHALLLLAGFVGAFGLSSLDRPAYDGGYGNFNTFKADVKLSAAKFEIDMKHMPCDSYSGRTLSV